MEAPANSRRRIIILLVHENKVLVLQGLDGRWHLPDTHLHWKIGKRQTDPKSTACSLINESTCGLIGDSNELKELVQRSHRYLLPTGGFCYKINIDMSTLIKTATRVQKLFQVNGPRLDLHPIEDICKVIAHAKYGPGTIEAIRTSESSNIAASDIKICITDHGASEDIISLQ